MYIISTQILIYMMLARTPSIHPAYTNMQREGGWGGGSQRERGGGGEHETSARIYPHPTPAPIGQYRERLKHTMAAEPGSGQPKHI